MPAYLGYSLSARSSWLIRGDDNLERRPTVHLVESGLVIVQLEHIGDHTLDVDLATIEIGDGAREAEGLRERANDLGQTDNIIR
jgi:hypothetical protein